MSLLIQLTIILAFALVMVPVTKRLGLPTLIGYVATGIALGPYVFDLIPLSIELKQLQHLGLLLLLFFIGMQLQPTRLMQLKLKDIQFASYALGLSILVLTMLGIWLFDLSILVSFIVSAALSLLSFSLLQQQIQLPKHFNPVLGQQVFNFGLIHSLWAVLLIACLPILIGFASPQHSFAYAMSVVAALSGLWLLQRYVLQPVFEYLEQTHTHELVLASAVLSASLSFIVLDALNIHDSLAALLAGFLISDSRFHKRIAQYSAPFKGLVFAAFFIVLGMSLPLSLLLEQPVFFALGLLVLLLVKLSMYLALARYFKASWLDSCLISSAFISSGEFGFILLYSAFASQLAPATVLEPYLLLLMLAFVLSPVLMLFSQRYLVPRFKTAALADNATETKFTAPTPLFIIGFGRVGQLVARVAHTQNIAFTAIDNHLPPAQDLSAYGGCLLKMDATDTQALQKLPLNAMQLAVIAVDDVEDNINIVRYLQLHYPDLKLLVRARDRHHAHLLSDLGIIHIWRETYLSALDLALNSLIHLGMQPQQAQDNIAQFRIHDQKLQRQQQQIEYDDIKLYQTQEAALAELHYLLAQDLSLKSQVSALTADDLKPDSALQQMKATDL